MKILSLVIYMKTIRLSLAIFLMVLCQGTVCAATDKDVHGEMGETYGTVKLSIAVPLTERVYYLALPQGAEPPTAEEIVAYIMEETQTGLADGSVVRGRLIPCGTGEYVLRGMEGLSPLLGELGLVGGMRYDIYLVSGPKVADLAMPDSASDVDTTAFGLTSRHVAKDVMAQPFERVGLNGEFYIHTAKQLANIQSLAGLYVDSQGSQGSLVFLTCPRQRFVLGSDIDLPPGWIPIGDAGSNPAFVFRGSLNGQGYNIKGLLIEKPSRPVQGLFGKLEGANISNLTLSDAHMRIDGDNGGHEFTAGLLAAEAVDGTIKNISIKNGLISVTESGPQHKTVCNPLKKDTDYGAVGGLLGKGARIRLANIRVDVRLDIELLPGQKAVCQAAGGIAGHLSDCTVERSYVNAQINAGVAATGGVVGLATDTKFYYSGTNEGRITGKNATGGFAGRLEGTGLVLECYSHADVFGETAGGLVGQITGSPLSANANHRQQIFRSTATGKTVSYNGLAGGFVGEGAYVLIKDSSAYGDVAGNICEGTNSDAKGTGGFVGRLYNRSRVIHAYAKGDVFFDGLSGFAGGFVGELTNGACIEFAYAAGSVIADSGIAKGYKLPYQQTESNSKTNLKTADSKILPLKGVAVGGFVGIISAQGAPNTITHSLSFAPWVVGPEDGYVHRFAGRAEHNGVNGCYAHLGSMVVRSGSLAHIFPSAYGADGADMSSAQVEDIVARLGWRRPAPHM